MFSLRWTVGATPDSVKCKERLVCFTDSDSLNEVYLLVEIDIMTDLANCAIEVCGPDNEPVCAHARLSISFILKKKIKYVILIRPFLFCLLCQIVFNYFFLKENNIVSTLKREL